MHKWKREAIETSSDAEKEVIALPKKLREVEMERDILKTCIAPPPESTAKRIVSAQGGTDAANVSGFFFVNDFLQVSMGSAPRNIISGARL